MNTESNIILTAAQFNEIIEGQERLRTYLDNVTEQLKNGTFYAVTTEGAAEMNYKFRERVNVTINGNTVTKWAVANSKEELFEAIYRLKALEKESTCTTCGNSVTFGEFVPKWADMYRHAELADSTFLNEKGRLNRLVKVFGNKPVASITPDDIQAWLNTMKDKAQDTVHSYLNTLRKCLDGAVEDHIISVNPARATKIRNPAKGKGPVKELTAQERAQIAKAIPEIDRPEDRRYLALLFYTGIRPEEAVALRWEDVSGDCVHVEHALQKVGNNVYRLGPTKTEAGVRDVPICDELRQALEPFGETGFIFSREGAHYTPQTQRRMWERIRKRLPLTRRISPYFLRHNYATMAAEESIDPKYTQTAMGHAKPETTQKYYIAASKKLMSRGGAQMGEAFRMLIA